MGRAGCIIGVIIAALVALILLGGVKRIGQVTERLVSFMAALYILLAPVLLKLVKEYFSKQSYTEWHKKQERLMPLLFYIYFTKHRLHFT